MQIASENRDLLSVLMADLPAVDVNRTGNPVDDVVATLVGTGRVRFGAAPNPDSMTVIRRVVSNAVAANQPIPMLAPWGSKKPNNAYTVDLAEFMALKMLAALVRRVQQVYKPGVDMVFRVEDLSGWYLFERDGQPALDASRRYVDDLQALFQVFGIDGVSLWLESQHIDRSEYERWMREVEPFFAAHLLATEGLEAEQPTAEIQHLQALGWHSAVSSVKRTFYYSRYQRHSPDLDDAARRRELGHYFATVLARMRTNGYGNKAEWGSNYMGFSFHPPIPDAGTVVDPRVYWRTMPTNFTKDHIPPWRARGYIKLAGGSATPKITHWGEMHLDCSAASLSGNGAALTLQCEYGRF